MSMVTMKKVGGEDAIEHKTTLMVIVFCRICCHKGGCLERLTSIERLCRLAARTLLSRVFVGFWVISPNVYSECGNFPTHEYIY